MKQHWWKVPLYCMLVSIPCFYLEIFLFSKWAFSFDGETVTTKEGVQLLIVAVIFIVAVLLGGLAFFRKMTRRQIFYSALVLSGLNLVMGVLARVGLTSVTNFYWMYLTAWDNVFVYLLPQSWVTILLRYLLPPHVFILFGKKRA